eukprot:12555995-Alexandrium_andersonii.AAC.1
MAVGLLIEADKRDIADAFKPHQFAVGVQSEAEALAKAARKPWRTRRVSRSPALTGSLPSTRSTEQLPWTALDRSLPP